MPLFDSQFMRYLRSDPRFEEDDVENFAVAVAFENPGAVIIG